MGKSHSVNMLVYKSALLAAGICLLAILQGCAADDGDKAKCAAQTGKDCHSCLQYAQCYYCTATKKCTFYPLKSIIPKSDVCSLPDIRWGTCWVNFLALIISVVGIVLLFIVAVSCWCHCWCKKRRVRSVERDERQFASERAARAEVQAERRAERQSRTDAIRQKYGLPSPTGEPPYQPL
ncbi:pituitary tumor-transforming gene 1 protein-interacting protein-like isoform X2 [Pollicipes pollicipes]|uniref:pituitary tumor-transforming gene 1 protein-interacting protein-like isoform X2 n=2 Tax=Pollicipes pollicipes TaxID=41117 RepID=UPI001884FD8C|nr:pituitary tumor-transforming gene 1 protein-interacting protein-like isoform X2 [Pollicipes pollicipes]